MKKYTKASIYLLMLFFTVASCSADSNEGEQGNGGPDEPPIENPDQDDDDDDDETFNYVFEEETNGFQVYRIPALVKTNNGTVLAFAEARKLRSNGDSGDIDLVVKSSTDNGQSWSEMNTIWDEGQNTAGNPVPIVDRETGRVHLLMTWNHGDDRWGAINADTGEDTRRVYYTYSDDDGQTWEEPREITSSVKDESWRWYGTGPVHGIQIENGPYAGRLVAPNYYTIPEGASYNDYSHMAYSDDNGETWHAGESTPSGGVGECTVAELEDGSLMLNMRAGSGAARKYSISTDGGETWGEVQTDYTLLDPSSQGSIISGTFGDEFLLFHSNPASAERVNMTVKKSTNNGADWDFHQLVHSGPSAYSDMVILSETQIGILYEGGIGRPYEGLAFEVIDIE